MDNREIIGVCKYCGQVVETNRTFATKAEAEDYATERCDCEAAKEMRYRKKVFISGISKIDSLCGEGAQESGFASVSENVLELLEKSVETIVNNGITAITVKLADGDKVVVAETTNDGIKVHRTHTNQCRLSD